jgi:hypothetical protein
MTGALHHVTQAALPVALGLLSLALAARAILWAEIDHAPARRIASRYLDPLCIWCLIATGVYTVALALRNDAELIAFVLPVAIAVGAVLLRPAAERAPDETPEPPPSPTPPAPSPDGGLWSRGMIGR